MEIGVCRFDDCRFRMMVDGADTHIKDWQYGIYIVLHDAIPSCAKTHNQGLELNPSSKYAQSVSSFAGAAFR